VPLDIYVTKPNAGIVYRLNDGEYTEYTAKTDITAKEGENIINAIAYPVTALATKNQTVIFNVTNGYVDQCSDSSQNQDETDVDCGGLICASKCSLGQMCELPSDCITKFCEAGFCSNAPCDDTKKNGEETDVDCGGPVCSGCEFNKMCDTSSDCKSPLFCEAGFCTNESTIPPGTEDPTGKSGMGLLAIILIIIGALCILGGGGYFGYEHYYEHMPIYKPKGGQQQAQQGFAPLTESSISSMPSAQTRSTPQGTRGRTPPQGPSKPIAGRPPTTRDKVRSNLKRYKRNSLFDEFGDEQVSELQEEQGASTREEDETVSHIDSPKQETQTKDTSPKESQGPITQQRPKPKTQAQKKLEDKKKEAFGELDELLNEDDNAKSPKDLDELTKDE
jgi:hypothetical protein